MSKKLFQDMVKVNHNRRVIRVTKKVEDKKDDSKVLRDREEKPREENYYKSESHYTLWFVAAVSIAFLVFALSYVFSKATITITPKIVDASIDEKLSATLDSTDETLPFDLVVINGEESKDIVATENKNVSRSAEGTVIIYNTYSTASQALNIDTRLEASNGKMYKTKVKTVVPGTKDGKPGSVEVKIYGVSPGVEYNSDPLDFKIFGFKGTPKYSKFYARSKGVIAGGFVGVMPTVSDAQMTSAKAELKNSLQAKLLQKATNQIPSGYILFKNGVFLDADEALVNIATDSKSFSISQKGILYGFLFNKSKLAKKISTDVIDGFDGNETYIANIADLNFTLTSRDSTSYADTKNIDFSLSGKAKIVWRFDTDKLVSQLLSKSKDEFNRLLVQYPDVESALLEVSPVWKMSIPSKAKDVTVIVKYP